MVAQPPRIHGEAVPRDRMLSFARRNGYAPWGDEAEAPDMVVFGGGVAEAALHRHLGAGTRLCLEIDDDTSAVPPPLARHMDAGGFGLGITTSTAFALDLAQTVVTALAGRLGETVPRTRMRAALQEAIGNAILHGNLGIEPWSRPDQILEMGNVIRDRMADPLLARRRLYVSALWRDHAVVVSITDEGQGFEAEDVAVRDPLATCGRGLAIIGDCCTSFAYSNGGRTLSMAFSRAVP